MRSILIVPAAILLAAAAMALAPATLPQPPATTRPQGPRDVLKSFFSAIDLGLPDDLPPCCYAADEQGQLLVSDLTDLSRAVAAIHKSASARFGPPSLEAATPLMISPTAVDDATETIDGPSAVVRGPHLPPVPMIKRDGLWKLDILQYVKQSGSATPSQAHRVFAALTAAVRATAANIDAGQYASIDAMQSALLRAQAEAMNAARADAADPATQ